MGHKLKTKCVDSRVNVQNLASTGGLFYTHDGASAKFSTISQETDSSVIFSLVDLVLFECRHTTEKGYYPKDFGAIHGEDLAYVFGMPLGNVSHICIFKYLTRILVSWQYN
jgi:hypothetical protein